MIETDSTHQPIVVDDVDADWLLALCEDAEVESRRAERRRLRYALRWAHLHPADPADIAKGHVEHVGGDGTPDVEEFTADPLGAAFQITTHAARQLISDALDLHYRLPKTWARVEALEVPAWRARRIAQATSQLTREQAAEVDQTLAPKAHACGTRLIDRAIADATQAPVQTEAEVIDRTSWGVRLFHGPMTGPGRWVGSSILEITGDTADLTQLYERLTATAETLPGTDPLDVRRALAVRHLDTGARPRVRLYVHTDLETEGVGSVERLGPLSVQRIKDWVGHSSVTVVPVIRMDRTDAVDRHDPPQWMRELVILRDQHCVFPWCATDARSCDLDHVIPYDDGGPTSPLNLAPLCRHHHRAKTRRRWRYKREPDGTYTWTGSHARRYCVSVHDGTHVLADPDDRD